MQLTLMGTACAASGADRDNTYLLLQENDACTLIDIGGNPLGKLKKLNLPTHKVKRIIFTHFHIDHIYGLPSLLWGMWIEGRKESLEIYCSETERQWLEEWLMLLGMDQWPVQYEVRIIPFNWKQPSVLWSERELAVSVFPSLHASPTVGIQIEYRDQVIIYSADTMLNPYIRELPSIDLLIHEATTARAAIAWHSSLEEIVSYYDMDAIKSLLLVHLTDREPYDEILRGLPEGVLPKVRLGRELMSINIE